MCTYFDKVVEGVDCFEVGIQQLLDFMGWKSNSLDDGWNPSCGLGFCISYVKADDYVVVRTTCEFGQIGRPCVTGVFRNFSDAVNSASLLTMVEYDCMLSRRHEFDMYFCYEVWHVVDDDELWSAWDHDAKIHRIDVISEIDCETHSFHGDSSSSLAVDYLYRFYAPAYGFLLCKRTFFIDFGFLFADECMTESIILDDSEPAVSFDDIYSRPDRFDWFDSWDLAHLDEPFSAVMFKHYLSLTVVDALEQMRDSLQLDLLWALRGLYVGGDVGETC